MSVEAMALVLHHSRLNGAQKLLLLGVANHDGDGGAYPSQLRLATYCGVSDLRNLRRIIDKCVEAGELTVTVQAGGSINTPEHRRSNLYELNIKCPTNCDRTTQHRLLCCGCDEPLPFARYRARAVDSAGVELVYPNGEPMIGWHKRCAAAAALEATSAPVDEQPPGEIAPGGEYAPRPRANTPPEPVENYLNPDIAQRADVSARERSAVDNDGCLDAEDGVHTFALHNGKPWRCSSCGIHHDELTGCSACNVHRGAA
jgi:hypothetical protein